MGIINITLGEIIFAIVIVGLLTFIVGSLITWGLMMLFKRKIINPFKQKSVWVIGLILSISFLIISFGLLAYGGAF